MCHQLVHSYEVVDSWAQDLVSLRKEDPGDIIESVVINISDSVHSSRQILIKSKFDWVHRIEKGHVIVITIDIFPPPLPFDPSTLFDLLAQEDEEESANL